MSRFYVPKEQVGKDKILIDGKEACHILDVMRMREGDRVVVFDGTGAEYTGFIKDTDKKAKQLIVEIVKAEIPDAENFPEITLVQALPKKDKMDYIVEKSTELGVFRIVPVITDRTITRPDEVSLARKLLRWKKIAVAASKQCGRTIVPKIDKVSTFREIASFIGEYDLSLMGCLIGETIFIKQALDGFMSGKILVFIGPEGDFTPEERSLAGRDNCKFVSLGTRVLKSDTAALFVLSVLGYEYGRGNRI